MKAFSYAHHIVAIHLCMYLYGVDILYHLRKEDNNNLLWARQPREEPI